jgi:hypothetical protein
MPFKLQTNRSLNQVAVYWAPGTSDGYGDRTFTVGTEIACRWEDRQDEFVDPYGDKKISRAVVYVAQDLAVGGHLYLGTLADLSSSQDDDPFAVPAAWEIRGWEKIPKLNGSSYTRRAWL